MKLLVCLILMIPVLGFAQPVIKIYAYSQVSTPGMVPKVPGENGGIETTGPKPGEVYYIYMVLSPGIKISNPEVWIYGKNYPVQSEKIIQTPIYSINKDHPTQPKTEILVPATKQQVIFITPVGEARNKTINASWFRNMIKKSELVVSYFYKGKKYFIPVKKIKALEPVAGV